MPRRTEKSIAFGEWVRKSREAQRLTQTELAEKSRLLQQLVSKIETQGFVPSDAALEKLCSALGEPLEDALKIIRASSTTDSRVRDYELDYLSFKNTLIEGANIADRGTPLQLFVIREDDEPTDELSVAEHIDLLTRADNIHVSIMFRFDERKVWESFQILAGEILMKCQRDGTDPEPLRNKFSGSYRVAHQEDRDNALPLVHPLVLVLDSSIPSLYYYDSDPDLFEREKQAGVAEHIARQRSIVLQKGLTDRAKEVTRWIGPQTIVGLPPVRWKRIPWPDESDDAGAR